MELTIKPLNLYFYLTLNWELIRSLCRDHLLKPKGINVTEKSAKSKLGSSSLDYSIWRSFCLFSYSRTYLQRLKLSNYDVIVVQKSSRRLSEPTSPTLSEAPPPPAKIMSLSSKFSVQHIPVFSKNPLCRGLDMSNRICTPYGSEADL